MVAAFGRATVAPARDTRSFVSKGIVTDETLISRAVDPQTRIGHVHLKVSDIDRALAFYRGVLDIIIISVSTRGKVPVEHRRRRAARVCFISRFCIPRVRRSVMRCGG